MLEMERDKKFRREISMVPLIDVVFQLLLFFLMAGTIQKFDIIPIDPPQAESGKIVDESTVVIMLGKHKEIILNDELVEIDEMIPIISDHLKLDPNKIITLKADSTIPAKELIEVMDYVKAAGGKNLSLVTQSPL